MMHLDDLTVGFDGLRPAVDHVTMDIPRGQRTFVIGESGSGKSVMLAAILRILPPEAHVSGSVRLEGEELLTMSRKELERVRGVRMAYIPQGSGTSLNPLLTVGYQVAEPIMKAGQADKPTALRRAIDWMRELRLGDEEALASSYPHTLSGGMRQRVLIAMGASAGAGLLLADEPTKGLDPERIDAVVDLIGRLGGTTLLCASHDLRFSARVADRIVVMYAGQQVECCTCDQFFGGPLHPYSRMMLEALPENGLKVSMGFAPTRAGEGHGGCRFAPRCPLARDLCRREQPGLVDVDGRKVRCHRHADQR